MAEPPESGQRSEKKRDAEVRSAYHNSSSKTALGALRLQLDVPVGFADELGPTGDRGVRRRIERLPLRPVRLLVQLHPGLVRGPVGLPLVARHAGQHAV